MGMNIVSGLEPNIRPTFMLSEKENGRAESKILSSLSSVHSPTALYFPRQMNRGINDFGEETGEIHLQREGLTGKTSGKNEIEAAHPGSLSPLSFTDDAEKLFNHLTMSGINLNGLNIEGESEEKKSIISLMGILANFSKANGKSLAPEERRKTTENDNSTVSQFTGVDKELKTRLVTSGMDALSHFIKCFNHECDKKWSEIHPGLAQSDPKKAQYNINREFCNKHAISLIKTLTARNATEVEIQTRFRLFRDVFLAQASTLDSGYPVDRYLAAGAAGLTPEIARDGTRDHPYQTERSDNSTHSPCQIQTVAEIHAPPVKAEVKGKSYRELDRVYKSNAIPPAPDDQESDERQSINNQKALKTYSINPREAKLVTNTAFDGLGFHENEFKSSELSKIRSFWRPRPTQG